MSRALRAGAVAAVRHSNGPAVTAFMDQMAFLEPVKLGDLLTTKAQVNWTGRTSMEVGVRVTVQRMGVEGEIHVASAHLVFVAIDKGGQPRPVPPVLPQTEHDRLRFQEAQIRRTSRGLPANCSRSFSKISTPSKPAAAMASSFSGRVPLRETVAIERCIDGSGLRRRRGGQSEGGETRS